MSQQKFVNREVELKFLEEKFNSRNTEFIVIYGRRRVGKSELILKFMDKKGVYFLCSTEGDKENISALQVKLAEFFSDNTLKEATFDDWRKLFSFIFSNNTVVNYMKKQKFVLCLDEFPFLIKANNSIPSIFQQIMDEVAKNKNFMLIVTGSFISIMESSVIGHKSPLYGRSTGIWYTTPLEFQHIKNFLPDYGIEDLIKTWFILGGIPYYILKFDPDLSLLSNIKSKILRKGELLYSEVNIVLNEEFREARNYKLILKAISRGNTVMNEIVNSTGLDKSMVSKYIEVLKSTGIIKEIIPVTMGFKFKKRLYFITDSFFNFWFRYIYPNLTDLEANNIDEVLTLIQKDINQYFGFMFELFVEDQIKNKKIIKSKFTKIGKWWYKDNEIDVMALNEETKEILFVECKWQDNVDAEKIIEELKEKSKFVEWHNRERKEYYAIFAKSFKKKEKNCYDLKDISKAL